MLINKNLFTVKERGVQASPSNYTYGLQKKCSYTWVIKGVVSQNSAKLENYKIPIKLRET